MSDQEVWVTGKHPVVEALRAGRASLVKFVPNRSHSPLLDEIFALARANDIRLLQVSDQEIDGLADGSNAQGVAACVSIARIRNQSELLKTALDAGRLPFFLALDEVQDPHNYGAVLRTAEAVGVHAVIVPQRRTAPLSGTVARASAGALSHLPIFAVTNLARTLSEIKESAVWVVGLDGASKTAIYESDLTVPLVLVVGSEGTGLRRLTRELCDFTVKLPMFGVIESLNVSVAASVAMYEVVRQRL